MERVHGLHVKVAPEVDITSEHIDELQNGIQQRLQFLCNVSDPIVEIFPTNKSETQLELYVGHLTLAEQEEVHGKIQDLVQFGTITLIEEELLDVEPEDVNDMCWNIDLVFVVDRFENVESAFAEIEERLDAHNIEGCEHERCVETEDMESNTRTLRYTILSLTDAEKRQIEQMITGIAEELGARQHSCNCELIDDDPGFDSGVENADGGGDGGGGAYLVYGSQHEQNGDERDIPLTVSLTA